jgi:hypothetical protein
MGGYAAPQWDEDRRGRQRVVNFLNIIMTTDYRRKPMNATVRWTKNITINQRGARTANVNSLARQFELNKSTQEIETSAGMEINFRNRAENA